MGPAAGGSARQPRPTLRTRCSGSGGWRQPQPRASAGSGRPKNVRRFLRRSNARVAAVLQVAAGTSRATIFT